ncbi:hypothetical protein ABK046_52640, partial [Streptomyces caeruleatus]
NIGVAKKCREFINGFNRLPRQNSTNFATPSNEGELNEVLFEAEIGYIGAGSEVRSELPSGIQKTSLEIAKMFVDEVR